MAKEALNKEKQKLESLSMSQFITPEQIERLDQEIKFIDAQLYLNNRGDYSNIQVLLDKFDLPQERIDHSNYSYLYPSFIVKNEITMIAAKPGSGKTLVSMALSNMLLQKEAVKEVIYFDADNGLSTLKDRGVGRLKIQHGRKLRIVHDVMTSNIQMWQIIHKLQTVNLENILIVFDSIKNFMKGGDRDKNKDVSVIMQNLKQLRNRGATVVFLHHTNKPQADINQLQYAGSSAWEEDTSNAFILKKNEYKKSFILSPIKSRIGDLKELAFTYDSVNCHIVEMDVYLAKETQVDKQIRHEIINFIKQSTEKPIYSDIMKHLREIGYKNNDKINGVIQAGKGVYWDARKIPEQNYKDVYELVTDSTDKSDKGAKDA